MKKLIAYFIPVILSSALTNIALAEESLPLPEEMEMSLSEPQMPARLQETGRHFELKDSDYLNIILDSSQPIKLILESVPEMVTLHIESASGATSTQITLGGFLPSTTYYKYEDNYHNLTVFTTDEKGNYTYIQDLFSPHLVFIQPRASTIFLTEEGFSDPTVGTWDPVARTATLTTDLNQTIQIDADNITLDGNGHTITSTGTGYPWEPWDITGTGVYLNGRYEVIIKNLTVEKCTSGIWLYSSNDILISNSTSSNNYFGIQLSNSHSNNIMNNNTSNNGSGICLYGSNNNNISDNITSNNRYSGILLSTWGYNGSDSNNLTNNTTSSNEYGIYLTWSSNNVLRDNTLADNVYNFSVFFQSIQDINTSNTVDGKPIYYWVGEHNKEIPADAGYVAAVNCTNITVKDLSLSKNGQGVLFDSTSYSKVENVNASENYQGICMGNSSNNEIINNTSNNNFIGIELGGSRNNDIINNTLNNRYGGICTWSANSNNFINNTLTDRGFILISSSNNNIINNTGGILMCGSGSNNIINNTGSIGVDHSSNNIIYLNNFSGYWSYRSTNIWSSTEKIGYTYKGERYENYLGNYWSNYTGRDANGDGIGDTPYRILEWRGSGIDLDNYPLIESSEAFILQSLFPDIAFTTLNLSEESSTQSALLEALLVQKATLNDVAVSGDLSGTFNFSNFEIVSVNSGSFSGKGFSKGIWQANLEGNSYEGNWMGFSYLVPSEGRIYLKGSVSGEISGIVEGYLTESIDGSNVYDRYYATWKLNYLGNDVVSGAIELNGTLFYQDSYEFSSELYIYQANMEGDTFGYYTGPLTAVITHLRINEENEYQGEGFSIISYTTNLGSGEGWAYNKPTLAGKVEFNGLFKEPLLGVFSGFLDEASSPKTLSGTVERLDMGLTLQPDLKVKVWGPERVSPGQTIDYIIEYRNDGLKGAEKVFVSCVLDTLVKYVSASEGVYYSPYAHRLSWKIGELPAKTSGYLSFQVEVIWGLPEGFPLEQNAFIINIRE